MSGEFDFAVSPLDPGLSVIEAGAGTGKTHSISHLVPRFLLDGTISHIGQILLVTFTNDAARELSDRVRKVLERLHAGPSQDEGHPGVALLRSRYSTAAHREVIAKALLDIDRLRVSTIHSFCLSVLQAEGTLCGMPVIPELVPDASEFIDQAHYDLWCEHIASDPVAAAAGIPPECDVGFLRLALENDSFIPEPSLRGFPLELDGLRKAPEMFTDAVCEEFLEALSGDVGWNQAAPDVEERKALAGTLRDAADFSDVGFAEAVHSVAGAEKWISARSKAGKAQRAVVASSRAVEWATSIQKSLRQLAWEWKNFHAGEVRQRVAKSLEGARQITYDGLISALQRALTGPNGARLSARLREQFLVALIDESQDTDPRQFEIFQKIFSGSHRLILIGDPKQAIYAFRGADVNTYLTAKSEARTLYRLSRTFRSPQPLVEAVNAFFSREQSFLKDGLGFDPASSGLEGDHFLSEPRVEAWIVRDEEAGDFSNEDKRLARLSGMVASEIVRLLNARAVIVRTREPAHTVTPRDFAVLVSDHRQAAAMSAALTARNVPSIRAGADDVMASEEAHDILLLLRAVHEPRRSGLRNAALASRLLGRDDAEILRLQNDESILNQFLRWQQTLHGEGVAAALGQMAKEEHIPCRMAAMEHGERAITNFRQLVDLLQEASLSVGHHPGQLLRWFAGEIARAGSRSEVEERQIQLESDDEAVRIVTMHAAKGLEFPLVFCPFLWCAKAVKGIQRLAKPEVHLIDTGLLGGPPPELTRALLEDRIRLAYVALTRAQVKVWVVGGEVSAGPANALDWLLRPDDVPDFEEWRASVKDRGTRHSEGIQRLSAMSGGHIALSPMPAESEECWIPIDPAVPPELRALPSPAIPGAWSLTSFSALTRDPDPKAGHDTPAITEINNGLFPLVPGGSLLGTAVHDWIEKWDFSPPEEERVATHLQSYGLAPLANAVTDMLRSLPRTPLPGMDCTVGEACPDPSASEWHFQLPLRSSLSPANLAEVFQRHGHAAYADHLASLPAGAVQGYLHGFLDRIAFRDGTWGVIDWKTNRLADYSVESMQACADHSHYFLQAHLYLVALRRFLAPNTPMAGAWLIFLRGIQQGTGVLPITPTPALLSDLDGLFL